MDNKEFYEKIPKIELHCHLEGAIPLEALWELIQKYGGDPSIQTYDKLKDKFTYKNFGQFIETWSWKNQFLKEYEDFTFISEKVASDLAEQNIKYMELFISPSLFKRYGLIVQKIVESVRKGFDKVKKIKISMIVDLVRDYGPENELITLSEINEVRSLGIIGIGIGGSENEYPPGPFKYLFGKAKSFGFKTNAHAGEAGGTKSIWEAIHSLHIDRIGHGTKAIEDKELLDYLSLKKIPLELCPLSNLKTRVINSYTDFPIKTYIQYGIPISINTDDPKMFGNSLSQEYLMLEEYFQIDRRSLSGMIINSIDTSWLDSEEKKNLKNIFNSEINDLLR